MFPFVKNRSYAFLDKFIELHISAIRKSLELMDYTSSLIHQFLFLQQETYERCVEPLVRSCFDGYNATVFAYGQTVSLPNIQ